MQNVSLKSSTSLTLLKGQLYRSLLKHKKVDNYLDLLVEKKVVKDFEKALKAAIAEQLLALPATMVEQAIAFLTKVEVADTLRKEDLRPANQAAIENAINSGDLQEARNIVAGIPDGDPYKASMSALLDSYGAPAALVDSGPIVIYHVSTGDATSIARNGLVPGGVAGSSNSEGAFNADSGVYGFREKEVADAYLQMEEKGKLYQITIPQSEADKLVMGPDNSVVFQGTVKPSWIASQDLSGQFKPLTIPKITVTTEEKNKIQAAVDTEWKSLDTYYPASDIKSFLANTYTISGNHVLEKLQIEGVFDLKNPAVLEKLQDRANFLIKSVDETTKDQIVSIVSKGYEAGKGWQEIAQQITDDIPEITGYRSELIARMETANAVNLAEKDFYRNNGITENTWVLASSHKGDDECDDNADAGAISIDATFPSGDDQPPAHVNCMCTLNTVIPDDFIENGPNWLGA